MKRKYISGKSYGLSSKPTSIISWLAREIGCTRNNIYKIFNKPSLDSDLILSISKAIGFNFFKYYSVEIQAAINARIGKD